MVDGFLTDAYKVLEYNLATRLYSKQLSEITYVVTDREGKAPRLEGMTKVSGLSNEYFDVFINDEPGTLEVAH